MTARMSLVREGSPPLQVSRQALEREVGIEVVTSGDLAKRVATLLDAS